MAWAHSEHGSVVACGSDDGLVTIWQQAQTLSGHDEEWIQRATLTDSLKPINQLQFAPAQLGPQLAVASDDGYVRFYEASAAIDAEHWRLCNDLQVCFQAATDHTVLFSGYILSARACRQHHVEVANA